MSSNLKHDRGLVGMFFFYNPNNKAKEAFKEKIKTGISGPVFGSDQPLVVKIRFYMRRPNTHFKDRSRLNALKAMLPFAYVAAPDIDNLAKFVLDGMNGLVY